jgi:Flp pilus assembly protein TadG
MLVRQRVSADAGSAALEFVAGALVLLVPCVYAVLTFGAIESAQFATNSAARYAARVFITQPSRDAAFAAAARVATQSLRESPNATTAPRVDITCRGACLEPGGTVTVRVSTRVFLPFLPRWPGAERLTSVVISAQASQSAPRFGLAR